MPANDIDSGFVLAGCQYPSFTTAPGRLTLSFVDYTGTEVIVDFFDVCAFQWQEAPRSYPDGETFESISEVADSDWLRQHAEESAAHLQPDTWHMFLNFGVHGALQVLCTGFSRRAPAKSFGLRKADY